MKDTLGLNNHLTFRGPHMHLESENGMLDRKWIVRKNILLLTDEDRCADI
jgi:hypothetical protein